jgi:hypothetical protein
MYSKFTITCVLIISIFHPCICTSQEKYYNSENIANLQEETSLKACIFSTTEHCEIRGSIKCSAQQEDVEPQGSGCM